MHNYNFNTGIQITLQEILAREAKLCLQKKKKSQNSQDKINHHSSFSQHSSALGAEHRSVLAPSPVLLRPVPYTRSFDRGDVTASPGPDEHRCLRPAASKPLVRGVKVALTTGEPIFSTWGSRLRPPGKVEEHLRKNQLQYYSNNRVISYEAQ